MSSTYEMCPPDEDEEHWRPKTRADCAKVPRPCPYVGCKYNNYLHVHDGSANPPGRADSVDHRLRILHEGEPGDMPAHLSCAMDIAEAGGASCKDIAEALGVSRQRADQVLRRTLDALARTIDPDVIGDVLELERGRKD